MQGDMIYRFTGITQSVLFEAETHGFSVEEAMFRSVLFFMLRLEFYEYSNELPLTAVEQYLEDFYVR